MSTYRLESLFAPRSVALVGASPRERSLGRIVLKNLREGGFGGPIHLVNPKYRAIDGLAAVQSLDELTPAPDAVVVTAPPAAVPQIIERAGKSGSAAAVVITAGLGHGPGSLAERCRKIAYENGLRIVGPNGLGVLVPPQGLNASFAARPAKAGDLALISQSGAIAAGLIEWSAKRSVGFSAIVSIGDAIDVDFGDLLDYFALDRGTKAILLYVEAIADTRKFMSAARAAARSKPVIVLKTGRHAQGARAAATHTGALAGVDAVYDAAFRRAGLLRVRDLDELFAAAETLARLAPFPGRRLAILTNGGGVGVLAVDRLIDLGGSLAELSPKTTDELNERMPPGWSKSNPVDIIGDADGGRYSAALSSLLADPQSDAVLVLNVPTALASAPDAARAVVETVGKRKGLGAKPVFAAWIGEDSAAAEAFESASVPHYATEVDAVAGFMHLVRYREAQEALMATPPSLPAGLAPDAGAARRVIEQAITGKRRWLDPLEFLAVLQAYAIPAVPAVLVRGPEEAAAAAKDLLHEHKALAAKVLSPDIVHKSDVGGVRLNLADEDSVKSAVAGILGAAKAARPEARIEGVTLHPMIVRPQARELIAGIADDPTFGPVVAFGCGGTAVEVIDDKALALPPLDLALARELIGRTRISRLLKAYRDVPAADLDAVALTLVKVAQMAADLPEIRELDLNPLLADAQGVIVLDARIAVAPFTGRSRLAIRPYPKEWERRLTLRDGSSVFARPVRPEDEDLVRAFLARIEPDDLRLRFFAPVRDFGHPFIARLTQLDYARAIAFVALGEADGEMMGVVRLHADANHETAEFAILVRSDLKGRGLGWQLMNLMIEYARADGLKAIHGQVLRENATMLAMCKELGFEVASLADPMDTLLVKLRLS